MRILIDSLIEGARRAHGTVVIIDVFRAFTTEAVAFQRGAKKIILVGSPEEALRLRSEGIADLCVGEVRGIRPPEFDYNNSPYEMSQADLEGKVIAHSTMAGTVGVNRPSTPMRSTSAPSSSRGRPSRPSCTTPQN